METSRVALQAPDARTRRFVLPKERIPSDAVRLEVVPDFMRAKPGEAGYWFHGRGVWGSFKPQIGTNFWTRLQMPLFGLKRGDTLWYAHMKTYRFDFETRVAATADGYSVYPSVQG